MVLAHGFAGSARNFRPQIRSLSSRYRVVVYDAPGHARSAAAVGEHGARLSDLVAAFGRVADAAADEPVVAGGLSLGAATALHYALERPERVRALVLASLPAGHGAAGSIAAGARDFADAIEREGLEAAGARFVWGQESGLDPAARALVRQGFLEHPGGSLAALLRGALSELPTPDELAPRLARCPIPSLVVAGAEDRAGLAASRRVAEALPNARLEVVEGAGHVVNLARPQRFDALLLDFLGALSR